MPMYGFHCNTCDYTEELFLTIEQYTANPGDGFGVCGNHPQCWGTMKRTYDAVSMPAAHIVQAHYSIALGKEVLGKRDLTEQYHAHSMRESERHQFPVNFQPVDPHDKETLGVTDEGLGVTHDAHVKSGRIAPTGRTVL